MTELPFQNSADDEGNVQWGIIQTWGHHTIAGAISRVEMFGRTMVRVVIPVPHSRHDKPRFHQRFFHPSAIYSVEQCSEETAFALANHPVPLIANSDYTDELGDFGDEVFYSPVNNQSGNDEGPAQQ